MRTTIKADGVRNDDLDIEYDETKYEIYYYINKDRQSEYDDKIVIIRKKDNTIIKIFNGDTSYIYQTTYKPLNSDTEKDTFLVCSRGELYHYWLSHYVVEDSELIRIEYLRTHYTSLDRARVGKNSFLVGYESTVSYLYNLHKHSREFFAPYDIENLKGKELSALKNLGENVLMVYQRKKIGSFEDFISYGINPDTFKIVTPIWSEIQERAIPIYSKEQVIEYAKRGDKWAYLANYPWECEDESKICEDVTITAEIEDYLANLKNFKRHNLTDICIQIKNAMKDSSSRVRTKEEGPKKD